MTPWTRLDDVPLNAWFRRLGLWQLVNNNDWFPITQVCPPRNGNKPGVKIGEVVWNVEDLCEEFMFTFDPMADAPVVHRCGKTN